MKLRPFVTLTPSAVRIDFISSKLSRPLSLTLEEPTLDGEMDLKDFGECLAALGVGCIQLNDRLEAALGERKNTDLDEMLASLPTNRTPDA